jgi:hypothetical protein
VGIWPLIYSCQPPPSLFDIVAGPVSVRVGVPPAGVEGVTDGVTEGVGVRVADADAEAEAVAFAVVDAACDALPAAWLLLVDDVQPAIDNVATITSTIIANSFLIVQLPLDGKMKSKA